jgi:LPXTG-motif cell wall-anchored protein
VQRRSVLALLAVAAALALGAPVAAQGSVTVDVATNAKFGTILTNAQGMTLYYRTNDPAGGSTCTGACAQNWPPLTVSGAVTAASGVTGQLTTFTRADGSTQVAYNGHALYTFAGDKAPGDVNGEGVAGVWHVATVNLAAAGGTPATASLPKTGSDPLAAAAGAALVLAGAWLALRRARPARQTR